MRKHLLVLALIGLPLTFARADYTEVTGPVDTFWVQPQTTTFYPSTAVVAAPQIVSAAPVITTANFPAAISSPPGMVVETFRPVVAAPQVISAVPTTTFFAPATPVTTFHAPTTTFFAPATPVTTFYAPTTTFFAPATATVVAPAPVTTWVTPVVVQPRFVPGQPVRNFFRSFGP